MKQAHSHAVCGFVRAILQIPSYFALILRAFSVIEGIALRVDPQYSIVQVSPRALFTLDTRGQYAAQLTQPTVQYHKMGSVWHVTLWSMAVEWPGRSTYSMGLLCAGKKKF